MKTVDTNKPFDIIQEWEERKLIQEYQCLAIDRQHLVKITVYQVVNYAIIQQRDPITGEITEDIITTDSKQERRLEKIS